ncbi:MAG: sigma-70 family RNA polymerase sigma factor [Planctomycetota bacterium]
MDANSKHREINEYAESVIRVKARQLIGTAGFTSSDVEDIEQELRLELLLSLPKFDPSKASYRTFVTRLVDGKVAKLVRYHLQEMRDYRRKACSLDELVEDADGCVTTWAETIDRDETDIRVDRRGRTRAEDAQLQTDVALVLETLPDDLREVAECVMESATLAEAAKKLGMPRTTLYGALERLRRLFEDAGLGNYLGLISSLRRSAGDVTV